jgi:regulator of sirC expression with transglutaminase-like and TPR domain
MPGHFWVREAAVDDRWYDPFHGGARLELIDCARMFAALHGTIRPLQAVDLVPTHPRAILARMLANLEHGRFVVAYVRYARYEKAEGAVLLGTFATRDRMEMVTELERFMVSLTPPAAGGAT